MSEQISIPEGMLDACVRAFHHYRNDEINSIEDVGSGQIESTIVAAFQWFLKNDTSTQKELFDACHDNFPVGGTCTPIHIVAFEAGVHWQRNFIRRMFK
jgi:hypothetical protein